MSGFVKPLAAAVIVVAVAAFTYTRFSAESPEASGPGSGVPAAISDVAYVAAAARGNGSLPDGTYSTRGSYAPHGVKTEIDVSVRLENDMVMESDVTLLTDDRISVMVTGRFEEGYKQHVIGKRIQDVELGIISGSSLTPMGYNEALRKIEMHAASM